MAAPHFKPQHTAIKAYYDQLAGWHLVPQLATKIRGKQVRPDGTLRDDFNLHRGYWEAKDSGDKLDVEIRKKIALGYPLSNTIFEDTATAVLFQNGKEVEPRLNCQLFRLDSRRAPPAPFIPITATGPTS
jgi:hypothetical protein